MVVAYTFMLTYMILADLVIASVKLYRKSIPRCLVVHFLSIMTCAILYRVKVTSSCDRLNDSLHPDYKYEDNDKLCKWRRSNICWHYAITGVFRPLFWGRSNCKTSSTTLTTHRQIVRESGMVSFALGKNVGYEDRLYYRRLQSEINWYMMKESPDSLENGDRESYMDFRESTEGKYVIKLRDQKKNSDFKWNLLPHDNDHMNILHIFMDTVSRQRVYIAMPKTVDVLKKIPFTRNEKMRVYEFFRHHALGGYTWPNLMSSMYRSY